MIIAVCVDDGLGLLFNQRRQSKDSLLRQRLFERSESRKLYMNAYSAKQFPVLPVNAVVQEDFLNQADSEAVCFVENVDFREYLPQCERLILYCWNRKYPADRYFSKEWLDGWELVESFDFPGSSHEMITEKIYEKK